MHERERDGVSGYIDGRCCLLLPVAVASPAPAPAPALDEHACSHDCTREHETTVTAVARRTICDHGRVRTKGDRGGEEVARCLLAARMVA